MRTIESGYPIPYGLTRVTPADRDNFASKTCLVLPIFVQSRRAYDINNDRMVSGRWILRMLITAETFHHAGLRLAVHWGWVVPDHDQQQAALSVVK